jgi:hypothetical protein
MNTDRRLVGKSEDGLAQETPRQIGRQYNRKPRTAGRIDEDFTQPPP